MLAVIKTGGKQYSVRTGQILKVEKLDGKKGDNISFTQVLAIADSTKNNIGTPLVEGAQVDAKIIDQIRGDKIVVFKKRKRQNYRSTKGHRQFLTVLKINNISIGGKKSVEKKITKEKPLTKKAVSKKTVSSKTSEKKSTTKKTVKKKITKKESK